jgi:hypothetical protein
MEIRKRRIIFGLIGLLLASSSFSQEKKIAAGILVNISGQVWIQKLGENKFVRAKSGEIIYEGDTIKTGPNSRAGLVLKDGGEIKISQNTVLTVDKTVIMMGQMRSRINLNKGKIYNKVYGLRKVDIKTPIAVCAVRGTEYQTEVEEDGATAVIVVAGTVSVENEFGSVLVSPGQMSQVKPGKAPEPPQKLDEKKIKEETSWQQEIKIEKKILRIKIGTDKGKEEKTIELRFRK